MLVGVMVVQDVAGNELASFCMIDGSFNCCSSFFSFSVIVLIITSSCNLEGVG